MTTNEQLIMWFEIYLQFYHVLNFEYVHRLPKGKGTKMYLTCGESKLQLKVDHSLVCQMLFCKQAMRDVTLMEQNRLREVAKNGQE